MTMNTLRHYLPSDAADWFQFVVLVLVVYALLRVVRGTIAASILRGTFILLSLVVFVFGFVLRFFELKVLQSILSTLLEATILALLVVFQPELRRALLSLGDHRLFHRLKQKPRGCIDVLVKTAVSLSSQRHGALFAVERSNALHHIVATGTRLDAEATRELLGGIFWPGAPLHDGGVVIRGDRVVAAGCIFPLAERRDLDSRFGTRHRAGIGLSEESDAVVVIVSEETGTVSVAVGGVLRTVSPPGDLARVLEELTGAGPRKDEEVSGDEPMPPVVPAPAERVPA